MENPFLTIDPSELDEILISEEEKKLIEEYSIKLKAGGKIVVVVGEPGSGKSRIAKEIFKLVDSKKYEFKCDFDLLERLRKYPLLRELHKFFVVYIDDFENIVSFDEDVRKEILRLLKEMAKVKIGILITATHSLFNLLNKDEEMRNLTISFEVKPLTLDETKKLIISRLNKVREEKSNDLYPFTEKEVRKIWKAAKGNPKMILLLCSELYKEKNKK